MTTPVWQSPTAGQLPRADHVNQFLVNHKVDLIYSSTRGSAQTTAGTGSVNTNGTYLAQSFTTAAGQSNLGFIVLYTSTTGGFTGLLPPTTVSLHADNAGAPAAAALQTVTVAAEYVANLPLHNTYLPLPLASVSPSTKYWLVMKAAGDASHYFNWDKSNQTSGASTSPDGVTWTAQAYGLMYEEWTWMLTGFSGDPMFTWEDNGARWTYNDYTIGGGGGLSTLAEFTAGQTATTYTQTYRTFNYTSGQFTGTT